MKDHGVLSQAARYAAGILMWVGCSALGQSQSELNQMAGREAAKADAELNRVYKQILGTLDEDGTKLLKEAQRAWITYRDAEARRAADEARGGTIAPMLYSEVVKELTEERIKRLRTALIGESLGGEPAPAPAPEPKPFKKPEPASDEIAPDGAKTQAQAAQLFFDAFKAHNRAAAHSLAESKALDKLVWSKSAGDASGLQLMDNTHIYYEGGHIELKMKQNKAGRWIIGDVKLYAD